MGGKRVAGVELLCKVNWLPRLRLTYTQHGSELMGCGTLSSYLLQPKKPSRLVTSAALLRPELFSFTRSVESSSQASTSNLARKLGKLPLGKLRLGQSLYSNQILPSPLAATIAALMAHTLDNQAVALDSKSMLASNVVSQLR